MKSPHIRAIRIAVAAACVALGGLATALPASATSLWPYTPTAGTSVAFPAGGDGVAVLGGTLPGCTPPKALVAVANCITASGWYRYFGMTAYGSASTQVTSGALLRVVPPSSYVF